MVKKNIEKDDRTKSVLVGFVILEVAIFVFLAVSLLLPPLDIISAGVGSPNVTVSTLLNVGNVYPEILNVSIENGASGFDLTPNTTAFLNVTIIARDFNGEADIETLSLRFFDTIASSYGGTIDNNTHYRNTSCTIDTTYGDIYEVRSYCFINVYYFANNQTWNGSVLATDNATLTDHQNDSIIVNQLLAFELPDVINYGTVNATEVSLENVTNVTNVGNTIVNLSLSGYGWTVGDGLAFNCSLGAVQNITLQHEKFNTSTSSPGVINLAQTFINYTNLTTSPIPFEFRSPQRQNDLTQYVDDTNETYWRVYVPVGVAGTCTGNVVFGATVANGALF